jgi:hypothetical protein
MRTLKEIIINTRCRKGAADSIDIDGAYWMPFSPILLRRTGGDGVGSNARDIEYLIEFRHYRSGEVRAVLHEHSWHQNTGSSSVYHTIDICDLNTGEDVIIVLLAAGHECIGNDGRYSRLLIEKLAHVGLKPCDPSPDEFLKAIIEGGAN